MNPDLKQLLKNGFISRKQYRELLSRPVRGGKPLLELLLARGFLDEKDKEDATSLLRRAYKHSLPTSTWENPQMQALKERVRHLASTSIPLLIWGEPGVGKSTLATFIHDISPHQEGPLITLSCPAPLPSKKTRSDSEMEERDRLCDFFCTAFQKGRDGSVQLKGVESLSLTGQRLLLQFIRERRLENRKKERWFDLRARLIFSCECDLQKEMEQNGFFPNLYHALSAGVLFIPPLRERRDEILPLAERFVQIIQHDEGIPCRLSDEKLIRIFQEYSWPGNLSELETCLHRMAILSADGNLRTIDLPHQLRRFASGIGTSEPENRTDANSSPGSVHSVPHHFPSLKEMEQRHIRRALELSEGNVLQAACLLKIHRNTLARKIEEMAISPTQFKGKRRKKAITRSELG